MAIVKPTVGATGWNTAVDALIDAANGVTNDIKEVARDAVGTALSGTGNITVNVNDPGDTIVINGEPDGFGPADHGFLGWSIDPAYATNSTNITAGVLYVVKLKVTRAGTAANAVVHISGAGTSLTNCYVGLFNSSGTQVAVTANVATAWQTTGTKTHAFAAPVAISAGTYYLGILCGGGTAPALARSASVSVVNAGLTAPGLRFGTSGTGLTAMPGSVTLSGVAADNAGMFCAVKV